MENTMNAPVPQSGVACGAVAGYVGGWVDAVLMRFTDAVLSMPRLLLLMVAAATLQPSVPALVLLVGCVALATSVVRVGRLMMSRAKITIGRAAYYTEVVAKGLDDYLSGAGEAPGVWAGAGATFEGVVGLVGADQMQRLVEDVTGKIGRAHV